MVPIYIDGCDFCPGYVRCDELRYFHPKDDEEFVISVCRACFIKYEPLLKEAVEKGTENDPT